MFVKVLCLLVLLSLNGYVLGRSVIRLKAPFGQVDGFVTQNFTSFLGIPYGFIDGRNTFGNAKPHPYLKPRPFNSRSQYLDLDYASCTQYDHGYISGQIQCLRLNVYTPNVIKPEHTLPVMVYIHDEQVVADNGTVGSAFPVFLLEHDVIVVTVKYRLGPYRHLCISNQALKDQNLALRWIKKNIESFGGDSDNILLFGHGAGSVYVHFHLLFNKDILFNKVILQSGVAVSSLVYKVTDIGTFIKDVGHDDDNIDVKRFIQSISAVDMETLMNITKFYYFRPCVDGDFIIKTPNTRNWQNIKLMIGGTTNEMLYFYPRAVRYDTSDFVAQLYTDFSVSEMADSTDAIDVVKRFYIVNDRHANFIDFASDLAFNYPMERTVRYYVQNKCTVYRYLFSYDGQRNAMKIRKNITSAGSIHGDELGYLFHLDHLDFWDISEDDQLINDRMALLWTNFAKYGDPTPNTSEVLPVKWTPVTAEQNRYLQIDTNLVLHHGRPFEERMAFWDSYYARYGMYAKGIRLGGGVTENNYKLHECY